MEKIKRYLFAEISLNTAKRKFYLVVFTILVPFVFLNFFEPFGLYYDKTIPHREVFVELSVAMLTAFIVLLFSQYVLRELFHVNKFTVFSLSLWFLMESVLVASCWFGLEVSGNDISGNFLNAWFLNLLAYVLIMSIPYSFYVGYIRVKDKIT